MNRERDIERVLDAWLQPGPTVMPDRLFDDVLERIERQPQRRLARLQLRITTMRPVTIVAVAAAITIAVGAGIVLLGRPSTTDVAAPTAPAPTVAPAPSATAAPTTSPAAPVFGLPAELRYRWIGAPRPLPSLSDAAEVLTLLWLEQTETFMNVDLNGRHFASYPSTPAPGEITFAAADGTTGCEAGTEGRYAWRLSTDGTILTLESLGDPCAARAEAFGATWTRSACRNSADTCLGQVPAGTHLSTFVDLRSAPGAVAFQGAFGQLRYTTADASWANADDWPDLYSLIPADQYAGPVGDPNREDLWHGIYVRPRPAAAAGGETCSTAPAPGVGTSAAELAAAIAANPALVVSEPAEVPVGSRTGVMVDVTLREDWTGTCAELAGDEPTSLLLVEQTPTSDGWDWGIVRDELQRLIFVDIGTGTTIVIIVDTNGAPLQASFDALVADAMPLIATFEFPEP